MEHDIRTVADYAEQFDFSSTWKKASKEEAQRLKRKQAAIERAKRDRDNWSEAEREAERRDLLAQARAFALKAGLSLQNLGAGIAALGKKKEEIEYVTV